MRPVIVRTCAHVVGAPGQESGSAPVCPCLLRHRWPCRRCGCSFPLVRGREKRVILGALISRHSSEEKFEWKARALSTTASAVSVKWSQCQCDEKSNDSRRKWRASVPVALMESAEAASGHSRADCQQATGTAPSLLQVQPPSHQVSRLSLIVHRSLLANSRVASVVGQVCWLAVRLPR